MAALLTKSPKKKYLRSLGTFVLQQAFALSALPLTLVAVLPMGAKAASLSSGSSAVVVLFSGRSQDPASQNTGMTQLNTKLQNQFGENPTRNFSSRVFKYSQKTEAFDYISQFPNTSSLGIVGYSWGGDAAIELAEDLSAVDLLVQVDSVGAPLGFGDEELPGSVEKGVNYYQSNPSCSGCSLIERLEEAAVTRLVQKDVQGADDTNVEALFNDQTITHTSIDNDQRLHQLVANNIDQSLIETAHPASEATLTSKVANAQAPVTSSRGSLHTDPKPVPEPAATLGILAFGALSASSLLKRKRQQKVQV